MTPAATPEALEQALASEIADILLDGGALSPRNFAQRLIAGPALQRVTAERDEARAKQAHADELRLRWEQQVKKWASERDEALQRSLDNFDKAFKAEAALATATAEAAGLRAEVEALKAERDEARSHLPEGLRDASLTGAIRSLALAASSENENKWRWGRALQIGLAFADKAAGEEWEHDGMASVDACYAMAAILECECGGSVWNEMVRAGTARFAEHAALARAAIQENTNA